MKASMQERPNMKIEGRDDREATQYLMINAEEAEKINLPADPNLLQFFDKDTKMSYLRHIYFEKDSGSLSEEFYRNLLIFNLYLVLTCGCYLALAVMACSNNSMGSTHMTFHVVCNLIFPLLSSFLLLLLKRPEAMIKYIRLYMTILSIIVYTYFIIGRKSLLDSFLGESSYDLPLELGILGFSVMLRKLVFDSFANLIISSSGLIAVLILTKISRPGNYSLENFDEFFIILIFIFLQLIDTKHSEFNVKKNFWMQFKNERSYKTSVTSRDEDPSQAYHSETELLISACDKIKRTLKHACAVIIFTDIKEKLKLAQIELEQMKQRIGKAGFLNEIKLEPHVDIDPEDKQFISQNYLEVAFESPSIRSAISETSVFEFKENQSFPFKHYGIEKLESVLSQIGKIWRFDIWFVHDATGHSLSILGKYLFNKWKLSGFLEISTSISDEFFDKLEAGYNNNPYHNACHAADVLHTQLFFILQSNISKSLTQLDLIACIVSSLGHDVGHSALTNRFLINNRDPLAIRYNDASVLENMHAALTFEILSLKPSNMFSELNNDDWVKIRKMMLEMILETDMSRHFEILGKFRTRVHTLSNMDIAVFEDKCQILGMSLKCADIGHSAKDIDLHEKWSYLVCEEFFRQGDLEKQRGQPVSMYCDRETTHIPKSQAGFIKNICLPLYESWAFYLSSDIVEKFVLEQLRKNLEFWGKQKKRRATLVVDERMMNSQTVKRLLSSK